MELLRKITSAGVDPSILAIATGIHPARMRQILAGAVSATVVELRSIEAYLAPRSQYGYCTRSTYTKGLQ